jgi:hypothetical protein
MWVNSIWLIKQALCLSPNYHYGKRNGMLVFMLHRLGHHPLQFLHNWHPNLCGLTSHYPYYTSAYNIPNFISLLPMVLKVNLGIPMASVTFIPLITSNFS